MKNKKIIILAAVVIVSLVGLAFFQNSQGLKAPLLVLEPSTISKTFQETGEIVPVVERQIYGVQGGLVTQLAVEEGEEVKKGDILVVVEDEELKFQLKGLEAQLRSLQGEEMQSDQEPKAAQIRSQELLIEQAKLDLESFQEDLERAQKLYDEGAMSQVELDDIKNMVERAKINLQLQEQALELLYETQDSDTGREQFFSGRADALRAQMDLIKYKIEQCRITAPIDGVVANLSIKAGDILSPGMKLMRVFQKDEYLVETFVPAEDVRELKAGQKVKVLMEDSDDRVFHGTIKKISPSAEEQISALGLVEQRVKVTVLPSFPEGVEWYPGSRVDVEFIIDTKENVLVVPKTAVFPYEGGEALWVVKEGKAKIQPVETGFENDLEVVVTGVAPGDVVITDPELSGLQEGKKIQGE